MSRDWIYHLTFHGLGAPRQGEEAVWVTAADFESILDRIVDKSWVKLHFDDGNESDFETALPALLDRGLPAEFFVVAERLDQTGYLSSRQIRQMADSGMMIGSHGMRHRPWRRLSEAEWREEIVEAKDRLEQVLGRSVIHAACPFGHYERSTLSRLREAGFEGVYSSDDGWARAGEWLQPRNTVRHGQSVQDIEKSVLARPSRPLLRRAKGFAKRWRFGLLSELT